MKYAGWLTLLILLFTECLSQTRPVQLHLQKNGRVKKRWERGVKLSLIDRDNKKYNGELTFMKKDTVFINGLPLATASIRKLEIIHQRKKQKINKTELAYVTLGVGLSTLGMSLAKWEKWNIALRNSVILGYSPYVVQRLKTLSFKKYRYRIGKRFSLRVWDLS